MVMSDLVSTRCAVVCNPNRLAHSVSGMASNQGHISETALLKTGLTADLARRLTVGAGQWIAEPEPNGEVSREKLSNLTGNDARTSRRAGGGPKGDEHPPTDPRAVADHGEQARGTQLLFVGIAGVLFSLAA